MSDTIVLDTVQTVRDSLKKFLHGQMRAKSDNFGPNFEQECNAEALLALYFDEIPILELFEPDGYLDFAALLHRARELELMSPEQDDDVCAALGAVWDSLSTSEQIELETKVATLRRS